MNELELLLKQTGCAEELVQQPESWEQLMTAVAAGAIDYEAMEKVVIHCAALAKGSQPSEPWDELVEALDGNEGDLDSGLSEALIACGKAADEYLRRAN